MKKWLRNCLIFCAPFLLMVIVNEYFRSLRNIPFAWDAKLNTNKKRADRCTRTCHFPDTAYCKIHHTKFPAVAIRIIDPYYNMLIDALSATGNYKLANIIFLVLIWPIGMFILFIRVIDHKP